MPLLLIQNQSEASASPSPGGHGSDRPSAGPAPASAPSVGGRLTSDVRAQGPSGKASGQPPPPSTTNAPPTTVAAPVQTTLPTQNVAAHAAVPPTTTTTAPPPPTTTTTTRPVVVQAPAPPTGSVHTGQVTYYDHPAGTCASPWLPFGTVVRITNPANGESVSCVVNDREADTARSIDLATDTFALIAPLSQGVIDADLSW